MATEIALKIMPIGNHMTNAEEIMIVSYNELVVFEYVFVRFPHAQAFYCSSAPLPTFPNNI